MQSKQIDNIFQIFSQQNPHPKTELEYNNNFTLAVAVILSAQATDISVNKATKKLFISHNTPQQMLNLGEEGLKTYIKTIGLYNAKAKNIIALCFVLIDKYNSEIPSEFEQLIELPGIGRKTANVILNCAFGKLTMAVDTHVYRVSHRIGFSIGKTPEKVEKDLIKNIPKKWMQHAHHWLILHGRYICKARKPLCLECPIAQYCEYYNK
ncbi:MAG: endonuclease III [Rickettsiaceae bacterium]|nr:endonuclease III [Rickettsiaceae bacterium]MDP5020340.1 endonuclease III [Rickettsiaceae bacterium]MDP5082832.1 endonuclease III [Rickettsiaceae bacterium]